MEFKNLGVNTMDGIYLQAKEVQGMASILLYEENEMQYTNAEEWTKMQERLAHSIDCLMKQTGTTPDEEAERVLAILMGYTVAVRNNRNIVRTLEQAEKVMPLVGDPILKCHLAVFCYGECMDEELGQEAHRMIQEQKQCGRGEEVCMVEELLRSMEENLG